MGRRIRATRTDDRMLLLKTNMSAGHGGKSGYYDAKGEGAGGGVRAGVGNQCF